MQYAVTNGGIASPAKPLGATRSSRRASSSRTQIAARSSQPFQQSQHDVELGTASKKQKKDSSVPGLTGSNFTDKRQTEQGAKFEEGSLEEPMHKGLKGKQGSTERLKELCTENSQPIEQAAAPAIADANYVWVQCDLCNKWRELPKGYKVCDHDLF